MTPEPRRRLSAPEPDTPVVVTLKDYVDVQIGAVDRRVDAVESQSAHAMSGLREELGSFKHEMRSGMAALTREVAAIREQDAHAAGSMSALQKIGVFLVGFVAVTAPIASLVVALAK